MKNAKFTESQITASNKDYVVGKVVLQMSKGADV